MERDDLIYKVISGSIAYGTNNSDSDEDIRGIFIPSIEYFLGNHNIEQVEKSGQEDSVLYTLKRFFFLASQLNPNIVELLFMPDECIKYIHPLFEEVLENKTKFLSQKALHTYTGYATAQIKKMKLHYDWYKNKPEKPSIEEYENMKKYQEYEELIKNRNPKRKILEETYGYDTKYAMHTYRLLSQGKEILTTGYLHTRLQEPDRSICIDILNGKWEYEEIIRFAEDTYKMLQDIVSSGKSVVPKSIDHKFIDDLLVRIHKNRFGL
jgi:predicted nucleotidyltransferase